jgi:hypothetical protein
MIEVKSQQLAKAPSPISVTLVGIVIEVKPQPPKAQNPILVTLLGIVTEVKEEQLLKEYFLI